MAQEGTKISLIAGIGRNRELGKSNELLWRVPDDLKRFKMLTTGHPVIMGRKTFESILHSPLGKPLPDRTNIVVTHDPDYAAPEGVIVTTTFPEALSYAKDAPGADEIFVIGGGQIYEAAIPFADRLNLTLFDATADSADALFPPYDNQFTREIFREEREHDGLKYTWVDLER